MRRLFSALAVCLTLLTALPAEARFGKRQNDDDSSSNKSSSSSSETKSSSQVHEASSPNGPPPSAPSYSPYRERPSRPWYGGGRRYRRYGSGYWYAPPVYVPAQPGVGAQPVEESAPSLTAALGGDAGAFRGGGFSLGLTLNAEGERWGGGLQLTGILIGADDGTLEIDSIKLLNAQLSYAFVAVEGARLRVEAGVHSAFAPDLIVAGPGLGLSGSARIAGPVGIEAGIRVTPFPFRQLDASAALTVSLGFVGLKGGWRHIILDDAGLVDGVRNVDTFDGPFVGLALLL